VSTSPEPHSLIPNGQFMDFATGDF